MFIDIAAAIIISLGFYLGYQRGLIKTVFDTLSLLIGVLAALKLSPWTMDLLQTLFNLNKALTLIFGIALTFLAVMILIRFIGRKLEEILEVANVNFVNKVSGGSLQAVFFAILLSFVLGLFTKINVLKDETKTSSLTYPYLMQMPDLSKKMFESLKPIFSEFWKRTNEAIDGLKKPEETKK
ncbi:MAG: CvpA family protein [Saprospiraceae bacterium]|nr:CvpA family protein [Saprospiraceae bacterium]